MTHSYQVKSGSTSGRLGTGRMFIGVQCMVGIEQSPWRTVVPSYRRESCLSARVVRWLPSSSPQPMPHTHELDGAMKNEVKAGPFQMQNSVRRMTGE